MSSGYPGHSGGSGHTTGHHGQPNSHLPPISSRPSSSGGVHPASTQILPPSLAPSPQPLPPQVSSSQRSTASVVHPAARKWYFTPEKLSNTLSVKDGIPIEKELSYRQQAANFIQDMGQRLKVTQLCINTAIVYMQRFFMFHSFTNFHRNSIASASLFLAAKVEEQPRKLEHVIKVAHICLHRDQPQLDSRSDAYMEKAQELVTNENILLQTLGFDVAIDHPHTHVVHCCQLVKASKELAQTSYFMATNSLHLTTMCLRHPPKIVACVCIHLACKWSNYTIPLSRLKKEWFMHVLEPNWNRDSLSTLELLDELTNEFLNIFEQCPSRLKKKIMASHQATKQEEERRENSGVQSGNYQPDFTVHNESTSGSSSSSRAVTSGDIMAAALGTPQQKHNKQAAYPSAHNKHSNYSAAVHPTKASSAQQPNTSMASHIAHGVHSATGAPGAPHSGAAQSQPTTHSGSNIKQESYRSSRPSLPLDALGRSGSSQSSSHHRHGDKHPSTRLSLPGNPNSSNSSRTNPQSMQQNAEKLSMREYNKRLASHGQAQSQGYPGAGSTSQYPNVQQNPQLSRSTATAGMDSMPQSRKRHEQQEHQANIKKAQLTHPATVSQNAQMSQTKGIPNQPLSNSSSQQRPVAAVLPSQHHQPSSATKERTQQQNATGLDSFQNSQSQHKYPFSRHSTHPSSAQTQQQQQASKAAWSQQQNISSSKNPANPNASKMSKTQQSTQKVKSIFDIDSPPPVPNQVKPFDQKPLKRTESLEPGEILDEESQEAQQWPLHSQTTGPTGTAPSTTITPLQQRLFGSAGQPSEQHTSKTSTTSTHQKDPGIKAERKYHPPQWGSSNKNESPVKQGKLNVNAATNNLAPIKQEPSLLSAASRKSLFSPPSDSEGSVSGAQSSPFKVMKSPANNNRLSSVASNTAREGRRRPTGNSGNESKSPSTKIPKTEAVDDYDTSKGGTQLVKSRTSNKMPNLNIKAEPSVAENKDFKQQLGAVGHHSQKAHFLQSLHETKAAVDQKPVIVNMPIIKDETPEAQSYESRSDREGKSHKKHKKDKKNKKEKKEKREKDRERSDKDRSSSKHSSHSKYSVDSTGDRFPKETTHRNSKQHKSSHHAQHQQSIAASSTASFNQHLALASTPSGSAAMGLTTPHIDTPSSTTSATSSGLKLKIRLPPTPGGTPVSSSSQGNNGKTPAIAPLRISLGGSSDPSRKRSNKVVDVGGHGGPASKMSRVLGSSIETEHQFLANKGLSQHPSSSSSKMNRKVK